MIQHFGSDTFFYGARYGHHYPYACPPPTPCCPPSGATIALDHRADCVIAMGGAAVIDAGKVIAAIAYADKDPERAVRRLVAAAEKPR